MKTITIKSCSSCMWCVCELGPKERKIYFRENWLTFLGIFGAAELMFGIWGSISKILLGS